MPPSPRRAAKEVIDAAILENWGWEWVSYALTILFSLTGVVVLSIGAIRGDGPVSLYGTIVAGLGLPILSHANRSRKENIRIRLLEIALQKAKSVEEVLSIFRETIGREPEKSGGK